MPTPQELAKDFLDQGVTPEKALEIIRNLHHERVAASSIATVADHVSVSSGKGDSEACAAILALEGLNYSDPIFKQIRDGYAALKVGNLQAAVHCALVLFTHMLAANTNIAEGYDTAAKAASQK